MDYTSKWNNFQFRSPTYVDGHFSPYEFDLVKWTESLDGNKYCYSVGKLTWDSEEGGFEFESVGLRFLNDYIPGLSRWITAFAHMKEIELRIDSND